MRTSQHAMSYALLKLVAAVLIAAMPNRSTLAEEAEAVVEDTVVEAAVAPYIVVADGGGELDPVVGM